MYLSVGGAAQLRVNTVHQKPRNVTGTGTGTVRGRVESQQACHALIAEHRAVHADSMPLHAGCVAEAHAAAADCTVALESVFRPGRACARRQRPAAVRATTRALQPADGSAPWLGGPPAAA